MPAMRTLSARLLPLCLAPLLLALCVASAAAAASTREVAMHGPNGDGGGDVGSDCAAADAVPAATAAATSDRRAGKPAKKAPPATRVRSIVPVRSGGDEGGAHGPRWHSFLPGMFR